MGLGGCMSCSLKGQTDLRAASFRRNVAGVPMTHAWDNFFIMSGTAGATLIGLLFVVITLASGLRDAGAEQGIDAFLTPTMAHFGGVLMQAMVMLVPWPSPLPIGSILLLFGVVGLGWQICVLLKMRHLAFVSLKLLDWIPYSCLPLLSSLCLIAGGAGAVTGRPFAPFAIAGATTLLLVSGIYGAWDLTLWVIRNRK
jgi:hypothetical protein